MTEQKFVVVGTAADTTVTITRISASTKRPQGLVLEADDDLTVADVSAPRIVLWTDTAPEEVEVSTGGSGDLRMWNVWRDGGLLQAWEGDARIDVDDEGDDLGLWCHDGHGDDSGMVVRLRFDRAWTQPTEED